MPNNILITPGSASIQFSGSAANTIRLQVEASGSIAFYGSSGSLFGISDNLSGSLMSVNDISGLPILEVFSDDRVVMGSFNKNTLVVTGSRVGIDKAVPTADLDISGSVFITGSLRMSSGGISVLSGSVTSSGPQNGLRVSAGTGGAFTLTDDGGGSVIANNISAAFRLRSSNTNGIYYNGDTWSPENPNARGLGDSTYKWQTGYINSIFTSGSITHTGSLNILSGSITVTNGGITSSLFGTSSWATSASWAPGGSSTFPYTGNAVINGSLAITGSGITVLSGSISSSGPNSGLYVTNGTSDFRIIPQSSWMEVGSTNVNILVYVGAQRLTISAGGLTPSSDNTYLLGGSANRWSTGHINNIMSSGSITHTGSLNILSGSVNIANGSIVNSGSGLIISSGSVTSIYQSDPSFPAVSIGATSAHDLLLFSNSTYRAIVRSSGIDPGQQDAYSLGQNGGRWRSGYINNIFSTGSIILTGSLNILSGSINVVTGGITSSLFGTSSWATTAATASSFTGYINFPNGLDVTGSLSVVSGSIRVTAGSITSSLFGTSSWASNTVSASFATTSSFAISASWAPGGIGGSGLTTKAGNIANSSFAGNPRRAAVNFSSAFSTTNYAVVITGEDARSWTVEGKVVGGFTASANSNTALVGTTYWIATAYGET